MSLRICTTCGHTQSQVYCVECLTATIIPHRDSSAACAVAGISRAQRELAKAKRKALRALERETCRRTIEGLDLLEERDRLWKICRKLPNAQPDLPREPPAMAVRRRKDNRLSGWAVQEDWGELYITLNLGDVDVFEAVQLLLHELIHCAVSFRHDRDFRVGMCRAAYRAYGIQADPYARSRIYDLDTYIVESLRYRGNDGLKTQNGFGLQRSDLDAA